MTMSRTEGPTVLVLTIDFNESIGNKHRLVKAFFRNFTPATTSFP